MTLHLEGNPHAYDFLHRITLYDGGECEFVDGAGQCICLSITGAYSLKYGDVNNSYGSIEFKFNTEYDGRTFNKHFIVNFKIQTDNFVMVDEIVWNCTINEIPVSVYTQRFVFDRDPFEGLYQTRQNNLYFVLDGGGESENIKCFYPSNNVITKKMENINSEELQKIKETNPLIYEAFIQNPKMSIKKMNKKLRNQKDSESD